MAIDDVFARLSRSRDRLELLRSRRLVLDWVWGAALVVGVVLVVL